MSITPLRTVVAVSAATVLLFISVHAVLLPAFRDGQPQLEVVEEVLRVRQHYPQARLIFCEDHARLQRDLLFYARVVAEQRCDFKAAAASSFPLLLLLRPGENATLANLRELGEYRYLPASALTLRGFLDGPEPSTVLLMANENVEVGGAERERSPR
jgi:hypothetical protein